MVRKIPGYPVMELFYTLQGEGFYSGQAAFFIRLAGCDVGCVWCDVKESWDAKLHPWKSVDDIVQEASRYPARIAVITGGEPTLYDLNPLCNALQKNGFRTHLETSGTHGIQGNLDWVTVSPKKFKKPLKICLDRADELKIIIYHRSDFAWAEAHGNSVPENCQCYLQPEWSRKESMTPSIIQYIQDHPRWQLSLQTHKYINIP